MTRLVAVMAAMLVLGVMSGEAWTQVAPTEAELAAYTGLHAAAAQGDVALIKQLVAAGANVNATDAYRRTPMHVAAYQSHNEAVLALAEAGGDPNLLEADRYDISSPSLRWPTTRRWCARRSRRAARRPILPASMTARRSLPLRTRATGRVLPC